MRRSSPPLWFSLCVVVALALALRALGVADLAHAGAVSHEAAPQVAIFGLIIAVVSAIWKGLEVAGRVTLAALGYSVKLLWLFASKTANALIDVGHGVLVGLQKAWKFFELTYEKVLKPAWSKFWRWFDKTRAWLDRTFGPTLRWLRRLRDNLLKFWKTWVRPWLDLIDVTRRVLRVLSSLGLKWAAALDKRLGELEARIERPFRLLLAKVNEVINLVNRVVTLDGLLQRVALIRSLERDMRYAWRAAVNWRVQPVDAAGVDAARQQMSKRTLDSVRHDIAASIVDGSGPYESWATEIAATIARGLQ